MDSYQTWFEPSAEAEHERIRSRHRELPTVLRDLRAPLPPEVLEAREPWRKVAASSPPHVLPPLRVDADLIYSPMRDARTQIRLLHFLPLPAGDQIALVISSYDLHSTPPFVALSYPWGEREGRQRITINGYNMPVQPNCANALRHLRQAQISDYYWIDAISIDQSNAEEKGHQVQMMADIFSRAKVVAMSYGQDTPASEAFMKIFENLDSRWGSAKNPHWDLWDHTGDDGVALENRGVPTHEEYMGILDFASRPYWRRMWIVQELARARNVLVLTYFGALPLFIVYEYLSSFEKHIRMGHGSAPALAAMRGDSTAAIADIRTSPMMQLGEELNFPRLGYDVRDDSQPLQFLRNSLPAKLQSFGDRLCEDVRDRIYAILSLINWPPGMPSIEVDYSISSLDLARRAWPYFRPARWKLPTPWQYANLLYASLDLAEDGKEVASMLAVRRRQYELAANPSSAPPPRVKSTESWVSIDGRIRGAIDKSRHSFVLRSRVGGDLVLSGDTPEQLLRIRNLSSPANTFYGEASLLAADTEPTSRTSHNLTTRCHPLYAGHRRIGAACSAAESGDYLAILGFETYSACIILRPESNRHYSIIGFAILDIDLSPPGNEPVPSQKQEYFLLHCDGDDMLALSSLWHDRPNEHGADVDGWRESVLSTGVCGAPRSSFAVLGRWTWNAVGPTGRASGNGKARKRLGRDFMNGDSK